MVLRRPKLVILFLLISLVGVGGIQAKPTAKPVKWMRGIYMAESPVPQAVPEAIAKSVADTVAREVSGSVDPTTRDRHIYGGRQGDLSP